jgi:hypothetical protein
LLLARHEPELSATTDVAAHPEFAEGLSARVVTSGVAAPNLDMGALWPVSNPKWLLYCNEQGASDPGVQRIDLATGAATTVLTGVTSCLLTGCHLDGGGRAGPPDREAVGWARTSSSRTCYAGPHAADRAQPAPTPVKFGGCRQGLTGAPTPHRHRAREHLGS